MAPPLTLKDLEDRDHTFPVPGKWNLVFFWSLFCFSCLEEIPQLAEEMKPYASLGCESFFIAMDTARMRQGLMNYRKKRNLDIRILLEVIASDTYYAADAWGVKTTPTTLLIDPNGKVTFSRQGTFDTQELWAALRRGTGLPDGSGSRTGTGPSPTQPGGSPEAPSPTAAGSSTGMTSEPIASGAQTGVASVPIPAGALSGSASDLIPADTLSGVASGPVPGEPPNGAVVPSPPPTAPGQAAPDRPATAP